MEAVASLSDETEGGPEGLSSIANAQARLTSSITLREEDEGCTALSEDAHREAQFHRTLQHRTQR